MHVLVATLAGAAALLVGAVPALAHASGHMIVLTLPTAPAIAAAGAVVALTAVIGLAAGRPPAPRARVVLERRALLPAGLPSWLSAAVFVALVAAGLAGSRDPLANPLPLTLWTALWVGLSLACLAFGDLWRPIDPWAGPVRLLRRRLGRSRGVGLARLGAWPACAGFLAFAWFEIVSLAPSDPAVLARAALGYWLVVLAAGVLEGEDWIRRGEAFSVYFAMVGRIAPLWTEADGARVRHLAGLPGTQLLTLPPLAPSGIAFVALVLAAVSFDGLAMTFRWIAFLGLNPLEFPGRSAVVVPNTIGLVAAWALTLGLLLGAIALGRAVDGRRGGFWADAGPWALSFLPIAAGYHAAHYLVALLTDGQYAIAALLGLPHDWVGIGFLVDRGAVSAIWTAQVALILGAHVLAVLVGLRLAAGRARLHVPMTVLMVVYTVFGLWLLSAPVAG